MRPRPDSTAAVAAHAPRACSTAGAVAGIVVPATAAALLYTLACPPFDVALLAWAAPALLLVPTRRLGPLRACAAGVAFGVLIGAGITHWAVGAALAYFDFDRASAIAFIVLVWVLCAGLPYGLLCAAYAWSARRVPRAALPAVGAWLWVACEMLRANPWAGMPWELLAHTQWQNLRLLQVADLGGTYAVSFVIALVSLAAGELLADGWAVRRVPQGWARRLALPLALLLALLAYGQLRRASLADGARTPRRVAVVQGSVPGEFTWKRAFAERVLTRYARLTDAAIARAGGADLVVWPENAVGFYLDGEPLLRAQIGTVAARAGGALVIGAPRLGEAGGAYNSAYVIAADGTIRGTYDKRRLLPFAEYDPLSRRSASPDAGAAEYSPGDTPGILDAAGVKLGTVICYEVIFPGLVRDTVRAGAEVLVNLSNDAWLDADDPSGAASRQHLSMAVFRAIETRRFLIRAASSGISGVVTPYGDAIALLPVGASDAAVASVLPRRGRTAYVRFGDLWMALLGIGVAAALAAPRREGT